MPNPIDLPRQYDLRVYRGMHDQLCVSGNRKPAMRLATLLAAVWPGCPATVKYHNDIRTAIITPETSKKHKTGGGN